MFAALFDAQKKKVAAEASVGKKRKVSGSTIDPHKKPKVEPKGQPTADGLSKSQKKKLKKQQKRLQAEQSRSQQVDATKEQHRKKDEAAPGKKMSLQAKMKASQFRNLNETLYTNESKAAWELFQQVRPSCRCRRSRPNRAIRCRSQLCLTPTTLASENRSKSGPSTPLMSSSGS